MVEGAQNSDQRRRGHTYGQCLVWVSMSPLSTKFPFLSLSSHSYFRLMVKPKPYQVCNSRRALSSMPKMNDSPVSFLIEHSLGIPSRRRTVHHRKASRIRALNPWHFEQCPRFPPEPSFPRPGREAQQSGTLSRREPGNQKPTELHRPPVTAQPPQEASGQAGS